MRTYGALNPIDQIPKPPDTVQTLLVANSSGQAINWAGSTVSSTAVGAQLVRFTGWTTAGAILAFLVSLNSTRAALPTSGTATGTTGGSLPVVPVFGQGTFQIPAGSTGYSVASPSSGYVMAEVWKM